MGTSLKIKEKKGVIILILTVFWVTVPFSRRLVLNLNLIGFFLLTTNHISLGKLDDKIGLKGFIRYFKNTAARFKFALSILEKVDKSILGMIASLFTPSFLFIVIRMNAKNHLTILLPATPCSKTVPY